MKKTKVCAGWYQVEVNGARWVVRWMELTLGNGWVGTGPDGYMTDPQPTMAAVLRQITGERA